MKIISVIVNIFLFVSIVFIIYMNINNYIYKRDNPRLFDVQYAHRPTKDQIQEIFDEITNYEESDDVFFINKGGLFGVISLSKKYKNLNLMPIFIENIKNYGFEEVEKNKTYCLNQIQAGIGIFEDHKGDNYLSTRVSWSQDNTCRRLKLGK